MLWRHLVFAPVLLVLHVGGIGGWRVHSRFSYGSVTFKGAVLFSG